MQDKNCLPKTLGPRQRKTNTVWYHLHVNIKLKKKKKTDFIETDNRMVVARALGGGGNGEM